MHNIPSPYPLVLTNQVMVNAIENTANIDSQLLKRLSRMYESGLSVTDISELERIDPKTLKVLLKLLGYKLSD